MPNRLQRVHNDGVARAEVPAELLSSGTVGKRLRNALLSTLEAETYDDEPLASALTEYSTTARTLSVAPERLLVALKDLFHDARAEARSGPEPELLQRLVVQCVKAYFNRSEPD